MHDPITTTIERKAADLQRERIGLTAQRTSIDERLDAIDAELNELEVAVRVYRRFANGSAHVPVAPSLFDSVQTVRTEADAAEDAESDGDSADAEPRPHPELPDMTNMSLADAAATVLRTFGPGARSRDLRMVLTDVGKLPNTKNSYGYLLKILREKPERFVKDPQTGTWGLREGAA